jgi:hypothetical protein
VPGKRLVNVVPEKVKNIHPAGEMLRVGVQKGDIAREFGVSVMSLWRWLR